MRGLNDAPRDVAAGRVGRAAVGLRSASALWIWPPDVGRPARRLLPGRATCAILGVSVSWHELLALVLAIVVAIGLRVLLCDTRAGITMRAVVDDRALAIAQRRPPRPLVAARLGARLLAGGARRRPRWPPLQTLAHLPLTLLIVNAYAAAMLGRLRSLPLTFLGAVAPRPARQLRRSSTCPTPAP